MFLTGFIAHVLALFIGIINDGSCAKLLSTLHDARIINLTSEQFRSFRCFHMAMQIVVHLIVIAVLYCVGTMAASKFTHPPCTPSSEIAATSRAMVLSYMVSGARFGRVMANGLSIYWVGIHRINVSPILGHRDGASGLAMVGSFFLRQSIPAVIPLGWLTYWMVAIFAVDSCSSKYGDWTDLFPYLIGIVLVSVTFGLALPMAVFACRICKWKNRSDILFLGQSSRLRYDMATLPSTPLSLDAIRMTLGSIIFPILLAIVFAVLSQANLCRDL